MEIKFILLFLYLCSIYSFPVAPLGKMALIGDLPSEAEKDAKQNIKKVDNDIDNYPNFNYFFDSIWNNSMK